MLPDNAWYIIASSGELVRKRPLGVTRFGVDLVLWRDEQGRAWAQADHCPHRSARLSAGRVRGNEIECPFHGFRFAGDGSCTTAPCEGPDAHLAHLSNKVFAVREAHGFIWMWWGDAAPTESASPWFEELRSDMRFRDQSAEWDTSYARAVENQLDWAHLPFVHHNSIGATFPKRLEIRSEVRGDEIFTWPRHMESPDGSPSFYLRFKFPNVWMSPAGLRAFNLLAFVPVSDTRTKIYVRSYQYLTRVPGLSHAYGLLLGMANNWIIGQDRRVVATQPTTINAGERREKLVPADLPIAHFRKELSKRARQPAAARALETSD